MKQRIFVTLGIFLVFIGGSFTNCGLFLVSRMAQCVVAISLGAPTRSIEQSVESPGGKVAYLVADNYLGAMGGFSYKILILRAREEVDASSNRGRAWASYRVRPQAMRWLNDWTLEIEIEPPTSGRVSAIERFPSTGVLVIEKLVPARGTP